jgi:trehalose/maltose hydrolase-like predicted phosphorylase
VTPSPRPESWLEQRLQAAVDPGWVLEEHGYSPLRESAVESRFAVSNGFLGVRGARAGSRGPTWVSWLHHLSWASWPRTFVAGLFDTPNTEPAVPALVPAPDWLRFRVVLDGAPLLLRSGKLLAHHRSLDLRRGALLADWWHRHPGGRTIRLRSLRLVSLAERSLGLQLIHFVVDQPGPVTFEAWLETSNAGLELVHIQPRLGVWRTSTSGKRLAIANTAHLQLEGEALEPAPEPRLTRVWTWDAVPGQPVTFWRLVSFAHDGVVAQAPAKQARSQLARAVQAGPRRVLQRHEQAWDARWAASDVELDGNASAQRALRFAVYHLNSAANPEDEHASIGARALTGDGYLGHVFWDTEIYLLPFYTYTWPEAARALLMYRHHTLPAARAKAARLGYRGALYAWESAETGEEATPDMVLGPDGRPTPVLCGTLELHISADIAYATWQYWEATRDVQFLVEAGAEIVLETARFWASRAELEADGQYHIRDVIGPDEYHEHIDDNAYTNVLAQWNLERGLDVVRLLEDRWPDQWQALSGRLGLSPHEVAHWRAVATGLACGLDLASGRIEQFAGYFGLEDIDLAAYTGRRMPMDVVLGHERIQDSQVVKQGDVVMLLALLPEHFERRVHETNLDYYEPRCGHGSSLSRSTHALVAARLGRLALAERYFQETAAIDLDDTAAGVAGGVRIAALGGLWQVAVLGFAGLSLCEDGLAFDPHLPASWRTLSFEVQWRQRRVGLSLDGGARRLTASLKAGAPLQLYTPGQACTLKEGQSCDLSWPEPPEPPARPGQPPTTPAASAL